MPNTLQRSSSNQVWDAVVRCGRRGWSLRKTSLSSWFLHPHEDSSKIQSGSSSSPPIIAGLGCQVSQFPQKGWVWGLAGREVFSPGGGLGATRPGGAWALSAGPGAGPLCDLTWTPEFLTPTFQSLLHPQGTVIPPLWTLINVSFHSMKTTLFLHFYFYIYLTAKQVMQLGYK